MTSCRETLPWLLPTRARVETMKWGQGSLRCSPLRSARPLLCGAAVCMAEATCFLFFVCESLLASTLLLAVCCHCCRVPLTHVVVATAPCYCSLLLFDDAAAAWAAATAAAWAAWLSCARSILFCSAGIASSKEGKSVRSALSACLLLCFLFRRLSHAPNQSALSGVERRVLQHTTPLALPNLPEVLQSAECREAAHAISCRASRLQLILSV